MSDQRATTSWLVRLLARVRDWAIGQPVLLITLLVIVLGVWAFAELADEVIEGETVTFDEWVTLKLRTADAPAEPIGPPWVERVAMDITALGGYTVLTLLVLAVAGYLLLARKRHAMWLVLLASGTGWALTMGLKEIFGRERPSIVPHLVQEQSLSFPSGHAMMSAVVYMTLGVLLAQLVERWTLRIYSLLLAVAATFLIGLSRVFLGVHYPTDVLAGWSAGLAWAVLCWLVARSLQRRGVLEKPQE
ncbi:MAG TPA: phosphatase PAP2 family protein [Phycisphaerae bacterium]|nr:phosphatase PAP2 family protein [Phycisphaerae bacterium]HOM50710.1 phosphatase PAP2 family protein [Phycisphaerae bacterium]HON68572.1 phosphatase PAP2 family protein [Phycisphaerae bacterium]HOQ87868.1 phosphatase PAP2 family protein [Phycisphaerae bacterium]HPP26106.1 phosphatase PAP2 family protein [Phycisphaerae bacterium]